MRTSRRAAVAVLLVGFGYGAAWATHTAAGAVPAPPGDPCPRPQPAYSLEFGGSVPWSGEIGNAADTAAYLSEAAGYLFSEAGQREFYDLVALGRASEFGADLLAPARSTRLEDIRPEQVMIVQLWVDEHAPQRIRLTVGTGLRLLRLTRDQTS